MADPTTVLDAPDTLDEALALWERHIGEEWRPGDIDAVSFMAHILRKTGKRISRSTASKWLADQATVGVYQRIDGVVHPQTRRRTTVYRPVRKPAQVPAMPAASGGNGTDGRRDGGSLHQSSLPAASPRNRKGKKTP